MSLSELSVSDVRSIALCLGVPTALGAAEGTVPRFPRLFFLLIVVLIMRAATCFGACGREFRVAEVLWASAKEEEDLLSRQRCLQV